MASSYDRIFADVRKDVPSVPDAVLRQELFRVMDDFTQHTNIWQEAVEFDIIPPNQSYLLQVIEGAINRLLFVYDTAADLKRWPASGVTMRVPGVIVLLRPPSVAARWGAIVSKRTIASVQALDGPPVDPTAYPVIDDWIVDKYADPIGKGVLARLQIQPQKPYSNPLLANVNQKAYISGRSEARINDSHLNVYNNQAWTFPQGWATVSKKAFS